MNHPSQAHVPVHPSLTRLEEKRSLYSVDPYFREGMEDLLAHWGDDPESYRRLWCVAPIIFRPDAVVTRSIPRALRLLRARGFVPIAVRPFSYTRHSTREGWRYQLNVATRERIDVMDMIMTATSSLYVVLRDIHAQAPGQVPACTRLSEYKGPSLPAARKPQQLRYDMHPTHVSVFTFVHIPDEPADLVRELAVFFDGEQRRSLLADILRANDVTDAVDRHVEQLHEGTPAHDLALEAALDRIHDALARRADHPAYPEAERLWHAIRQGKVSHWRALLGALDAAQVAVEPWDRTTVAAWLSTRHVEGARSVLPDVKLAHWHAP